MGDKDSLTLLHKIALVSQSCLYIAAKGFTIMHKTVHKYPSFTNGIQYVHIITSAGMRKKHVNIFIKSYFPFQRAFYKVSCYILKLGGKPHIVDWSRV